MGSGGAKPLLLHMRLDLVQRLRDGGEHIVDLFGRDDERRTEGDDVARKRAKDEPVALRGGDDGGADAGLGIEAALVRLVGDELDGADEALGARMTDKRMIGEALDMALEAGREAAHMADNVALVALSPQLQLMHLGAIHGGVEPDDDRQPMSPPTS